MVSTSSHETEADHQLARQPGKPARDTAGRDVEEAVRPGEEEEQVSSTETMREKGEDQWTVKWDGPDDPQDPLNTPGWQKWCASSQRRRERLLTSRLMTILLAAACVCVTCCSSMAGSTYAGMKEDFGVGEEVCILSISLFVAGLGCGPCEWLFRDG